MTALPVLLPHRLTTLAAVPSAYSTIRQFEYSVRYNNPLRLSHARVLGYLLLEGPSDKARTTVAQEIISCNGDKAKLAASGKFYHDNYIRACRLLQCPCFAPL
jgi:hypothetical protein